MPTVTRGFKSLIKPLPSQIANINLTIDGRMAVYNELLDRISINRAKYPDIKDPERIHPNKTNLSSMLTLLKYEAKYLWLQTVSSVALQESAFDLADAFKRFFSGKAKYPKPKHKHSRKSFRLTYKIGFRLKGYFSDILEIALEDKPIHVIWSRPLPSEPSYATISRKSSGKYFVSFTCTFEQDMLAKPSTSDDVGGDIGLNDYLAIMGKHTQEKVPNPRCFRNTERNLANKQRIADRKRPGSISHQKAQKAVARIYERGANQRNDILHKLTTRIVADNDNICIETINAKGMMANHRLAKSIADASFNTFSNQIVYKAIGSGNTRIMKAKRFYPSTQICSSCDTPSKDKIVLGVKSWTCSTCGAEHDRDYNAATNLRNLIAKNSGTFEHLPNKGYGALLIVD